MTETAPLVARLADDPIAWLSEPLGCLGQISETVTTRMFLGHVERLSRSLPVATHAINLCENRYLFLVSLCAAILRGQTNLLPSNKNTATQKRLSVRYPHTYIVHDGKTELAKLPQLDVCGEILYTEDGASERHSKVPQIDLEHVAAISFTSGSTGDAKPNIKTWRTLVESTRINSKYMLPNHDETFYHLATVPGQHMWGFETSVLLVLFAKVCMADARPLYPHDIRTLLGRLPAPRALVVTPLHLRALNATNRKLVPLANILSATAPLSQQLAADIENRFDTKVREIYGCSEVGSMALRRTSKTDIWEKFDGLKFEHNDAGNVSVSAAHLPGSVQLEDTLEMLDDKHFQLLGRAADQINIAGKRGSLNEVNKVLMSFGGLEDGIVFFPPQDRPVSRLVALVVLPGKLEKQDLQAHFRRYLDAAFIPRPIIQVAALPREDNGKLIKSRLLEFYSAQLGKH